jgi:hypothetical protein
MLPPGRKKENCLGLKLGGWYITTKSLDRETRLVEDNSINGRGST